MSSSGDSPREPNAAYSSEFKELLALTSSRPLLKRDLKGLGFEESPALEAAWDAVAAVRKAQATSYCAVHYFYDAQTGRVAVRRGWSTFPESLRYSLRRITALTRRGSEIDSIVSEREDGGFITQEYVEELGANLAYDGFSTSYEELRATLTGDRPTMTAAQRVVLNYHRIMVDMPTFDEGPLSVEGAQTLYDRLVEGVPQDTAPEFPPSRPIPTFGAMELEAPSSLAITSVCAFFNGKLSSPWIDPVLLSFDINCFFWYNRVFPLFNNLMGCIFSRWFLCRAGFPVFRYLPKVLVYKRWGEGDLRDRVPYTLAESFVIDNDSMDYTLVYDQVMKLMVEYLENMARSLRGVRDADDSAISLIERVPHINPRQIEVLKKAVLEGKAIFTIRAHQNRWRVAYSTARADLMKLVDLGLLTETYEGTTLCYQAAPHLKTRLAELGQGQA